MFSLLAFPGARLLAGALFFLALAALYLRYLRRESWRLILLIAIVAAILDFFLPGFMFVSAIIALGALLLLFVRGRGAIPDYVPAIARIEGGGIKRGLTAPEAAIVLGKPLYLTITLLLFEMLRKGFVEQASHTPLQLALMPAFRTSRKNLSAVDKKELRRKAAQAIPASLHLYEEAFLEILEMNEGKDAAAIDYGIAIQPLIRFVASRVGGYDLSETKAYYRLLVERAPKEARSDGVLTFERQKVFDRNFAFLLINEDFEDILDQDDYSYIPVWWRKASAELPQISFALWTKELMRAIESALAQKQINLDLQKEEDLLTVTLMNEIARATYYG